MNLSLVAGPDASSHPVVACVEVVEAALKDASGADPVFLAAAEKADVLVRLTRLRDQVEALRMAVLASASDVAEEQGARSAGAWLASVTREHRGATLAAERLAADLERRYAVVGAGVREGTVSVAQAQVIVRSLNELAAAESVGLELVARAEGVLVEHAVDFGPAELRRLGQRVLEVLDPEGAEAAEWARLQAEERRARAETRLSIRVRGDGTVDVSARLPEAVGARLKTYLEAYTSPRQEGARDPATAERLRPERARGEAFCALLERLDPNKLPQHGGTATTVVVTIDLASLAAAHGIAALADGSRITAGEARRLACTAGIIPAVLGGRSEVLDLGRQARLFSPAQHRALQLRDRGCRADGCDVPATWCEAHHLTPWAQGGRTDLADGVLFCSWHHRRAHDPAYDLRTLPSGDVRFHRRR